MDAQTKFTTINHEAREELGLSWLEYGLADLIYNLSANNSGDYPGWCYASKEKLADSMGVSRREIYNILKTLEDKKLIERHPVTKHIKTTSVWYNKIILKHSAEFALPVQNLHSAENALEGGSAENALDTSYNSKVSNINTEYINNNNNVTNVTETSSLKISPVKPKTLTKVSLPPLKYATLADLTETDFSEIAEHYQLPLAFVRSKYDDMCLWAGERPGNPKLRGRNWRLTLMAWVKKDALRITERSKGDPSKRSIDARNL